MAPVLLFHRCAIPAKPPT
eukprot:CCRYP_008991-RA/>CCRYP_008991-RA protein AED:0.42 eAED:1.00 QI:0/-1/0/1/-1/0/1/0/18